MLLQPPVLLALFDKFYLLALEIKYLLSVNLLVYSIIEISCIAILLKF